MKKMLILFIVLLLIITVTACGSRPVNNTDATTASEEPVDGGWGDSSSIAVSDEVAKMFDKINETLTGAYYVPIVYLSSQVVAGTNHLVLCKEIPSLINYDALGTYVIVTVYEDLDGNAEITQVLHSSMTAPQPYDPDNPTAGGYGEPKSYEPTDEAKAALEKAVASTTDLSYEPVALLGTQIVAGKNYRMLCRSNEGNYVILTIYADLQGEAEITAADHFNADETDVTPDSENYAVYDAASDSAQEE